MEHTKRRKNGCFCTIQLIPNLTIIVFVEEFQDSHGVKLFNYYPPTFAQPTGRKLSSEAFVQWPS
jgi:hypothetical protein